MWLIIGYGNRLRGDDGAGPLLAEKLAGHFSAEQAKVIISHQLTPELALEIAAPEIQQVLFIDAKRQQAVASAITPLSPDATVSCGHQMPPQLLLQLAAQLYQRPCAGWLLTIAGQQFAFTEQLSDYAKQNSRHAFEQAMSIINSRHLSEAN